MYAVELQKFADNASEAILKTGKLVSLFKSLNFHIDKYKDGHRGLCPICSKSALYVGTGGSFHKIWWRCFDKSCPSNNGEQNHTKNLLGLVRVVSDNHSLGVAIQTISKFLGARSSADITSGKFEAKPKPEPVADMKTLLKSLSDEARKDYVLSKLPSDKTTHEEKREIFNALSKDTWRHPEVIDYFISFLEQELERTDLDKSKEKLLRSILDEHIGIRNEENFVRQKMERKFGAGKK